MTTRFYLLLGAVISLSGLLVLLLVLVFVPYGSPLMSGVSYGEPAMGLADAVHEEAGHTNELDHDQYTLKDSVRVADLTSLQPRADPMEQLWQEVSTEELQLHAALAREGISSTPQIVGLLDAYRQGATKERLLGYIDTHFHALAQMPERAAALTWLLNLHPDLVQKRNAQGQRIGRAQPVLDGIQPAREE